MDETYCSHSQCDAGRASRLPASRGVGRTVSHRASGRRAERYPARDGRSQLRHRDAPVWRFWLAAILLLWTVVACGGGKEGTPPDDAAQQPSAEVAANPSSVPGQSSSPTETEAPTPAPTIATPPAPLAALVNGEYIFLEDYDRRVGLYEQAIEDQGLDLESPEGQAELAQMRLDVLEGMIDFALIRQEGVALGMDLSDEELDAQLEADVAAGGGEDAFDEWLAATGQTPEDYKEMLHELLLSQRMMEMVAADLPGTAEQVHIRHIAVSNEEAAQEIVAELASGADFAELARGRSEDTVTAESGGDLGWLPPGVVAAELERVAFALQPGEISGVIAVDDGYHVIQVLEREADRPVAPELQIDVELAAFEQWLEGLRGVAVIERYVEQ
jgi:foldase protein PrsA